MKILSIIPAALLSISEAAANQMFLLQLFNKPQNPFPMFPTTPANLTQYLIEKDWLENDDALVNELLLSKRENVHGLLYDEVQELQERILHSFSDVVTRESIGKSGDGRDIWMLKLTPNTSQNRTDKGALLLTGAHHARELVSVQMGLYTLLDLLQAYAKYSYYNLDANCNEEDPLLCSSVDGT